MRTPFLPRFTLLLGLTGALACQEGAPGSAPSTSEAPSSSATQATNPRAAQESELRVRAEELARRLQSMEHTQEAVRSVGEPGAHQTVADLRAQLAEAQAMLEKKADSSAIEGKLDRIQRAIDDLNREARP